MMAFQHAKYRLVRSRIILVFMIISLPHKCVLPIDAAKVCSHAEGVCCDHRVLRVEAVLCVVDLEESDITYMHGFERTAFIY